MITPEQAIAAENKLCQRRGDARRERDRALARRDALHVELERLKAALIAAEQAIPHAERLVLEAEAALAKFQATRTQEGRLAAAREARVKAMQELQLRAAAADQAAAKAREDQIQAQEALTVALMGGAE